jgi:hypothetical protein
MTGTELRRLAEAARTLLHLLLPDAAEVQRLRALLDAALALPPGQADLAILRALSGNAVLRGWVAEQRSPRLRAPVAYLTAHAPDLVPRGHDFSVLVQLTGTRHRISAALRGLDPRPAGTAVTITAGATAGLQPLSPLRQELAVPPDGDSPAVEFRFRGTGDGSQTVTLHAFAGGTFLGGLATEIRVHADAVLEPGVPRQAELASTDGEPGDVTLEVRRGPGGQYSVQLIGGGAGGAATAAGAAGPPLPLLLLDEPRRVVRELLDELRRFAVGKSGYGSATDRRERLRNLGVELWGQAVPEAVRRQFWEVRAGINSFRVLSDSDPVPWELLYPLDGGHDDGFLVDQFPVLRQVGQQRRARSLPVRSVAFVVSRRRPVNAEEELRRVRQLLGPGVHDRGRITRREELTAMLEAPPGVLHFACHNEATGQTEAALMLDDGGPPFRPTDLAVAAAKQSLAGAAPVVFFNACRSADEIPGLTRPVGWASKFMAAGAGAFLGTLWPVSSGAALRFADAFYGSFITAGQPLGAAVAQARAEVAGDGGDPTWLAYAVYGEAGTTARVPAGDSRG